MAYMFVVNVTLLGHFVLVVIHSGKEWQDLLFVELLNK